MVKILNISRGDVEQVALLARLELTEQEIVLYTGQLDSILEYAEVLNRLDTENVVPTAHAVPLHNVLRDDQVKPSLAQEKVLANAPEVEDGFFRVPKIV